MTDSTIEGETFTTSEEIDYPVLITLRGGAVVATFVGATVRVDAINQRTGVKVAGSCVVTDTMELHNNFAKGSLVPGAWDLQTIAKPIGMAERCVDRSRILVVQGATP